MACTSEESQLPVFIIIASACNRIFAESFRHFHNTKCTGVHVNEHPGAENGIDPQMLPVSLM
jgi:hypothetical protein